MKFILLLLSLIIFISPLYAKDYFTIPSSKEFMSWVNGAAINNKDLRQKLKSIDDNYEIVFIPGILGSRLTIGDYIYGEHPTRTDKLIFDKKQEVIAETLNKFQAIINLKAIEFKTKVDIYGSGLDDLKACYKGRDAKVFAYDWRNDIRNIADKFQEHSKDKDKLNLSGKRVIIIAHSMGGIVAWQWKNTYKEDRPFTLVALVLIGSPIQGSCEPAKMLVEGYSAPVDASIFEHVASHLVFEDAHPAIFTFPSVFQLLPQYSDESPCLKLKILTGEELNQDHHLVDTWLGRDGGSYKLGGINDSKRKDFFKKVGIDNETYLARVKDAIKAGKDFRADFDLAQHDDHVYYLYSKKIWMPQLYPIVTNSEGWLSLDTDSIAKYSNSAGDGRVPYKSAINDGYASRLHGPTVILTEEHGKLLSDKNFPTFVAQDINDIIGEAKIIELAAFASNNPNLRREMETRNWLFDPKYPTNSFVKDEVFSSAVKKISL
jgi:pimeloyl-ACP methyl ester carboxylesterase